MMRVGGHIETYTCTDRMMRVYLDVITEIITFCVSAGPFTITVSTAEFIGVRIWDKVVEQFLRYCLRIFLGKMWKAQTMSVRTLSVD
jgi:hypothetical protein